MPPKFLQLSRLPSTETLVARETARRQQLSAQASERRRQRRREWLEDIDRYGAAVARQMRRDERGPNLKPLSNLTPAQSEASDAETVKLRGELEANGIRISVDDAREITADERSLIAEVHSRLRSGWGAAPMAPTSLPTPAPESTDNDKSDENGAEAVAAACSLTIPITAAQVRRYREAQKRYWQLHDEKSRQRHLNSAPIITSSKWKSKSPPKRSIDVKAIYERRRNAAKNSLTASR